MTFYNDGIIGELTREVTRKGREFDFQKIESALLKGTFNDQGPFYAQTLYGQMVIKTIIRDDNLLNHRFEKTMVSSEDPFYGFILEEMQRVLDLYHYDFKANYGRRDYRCLEEPIFTVENLKLYEAFESKKPEILLHEINLYIYTNGLGLFEGNRSFRINYKDELVAIKGKPRKALKDLLGYELQKESLYQNTKALIEGKQALNVLLEGDMGTGKSTMVKALINEFDDPKFKMVEIKKSQFDRLPQLIEKLKDRPYAFIFFIDDLSFEKDDDTYKTFKTVLEGSLEESPQNICIYATSNKRHLITETLEERKNAVHQRDVMEEKLSLVSRFGIVLAFSEPVQKEYLAIVQSLAKEQQIKMPPEALEAAAKTWAMEHLNRSGRTAEQFIAHLSAQQQNG